MNTIILPIKPEYANMIFSGRKKYEFRRRIPKKKISKIIVYSTHPDKVVIGEVEVIEIVSLKIDELWNLTQRESGINKEIYNNYFKDIDRAHAFKLGSVTKYNSPKALSDYNIRNAPQSFIYLNE